MPIPVALCLEDLAPARAEDRYLQCVALGGRMAGLGLTSDGRVCWESDEPLALEVWVSADERLMIFRPAGACGSVLRRAHRVLDVPEGKPVVVLAGDEVQVGSRRFRIHVHGPAPQVVPPRPFVPAAPPSVLHRAGARLVAMGAALGLGACPGPRIDVLPEPPKVAPPDDPPPEEPVPVATPPETIPEVTEPPPPVPEPPPLPPTTEPPPPIEVIPMPPSVPAPDPSLRPTPPPSPPPEKKEGGDEKDDG